MKAQVIKTTVLQIAGTTPQAPTPQNKEKNSSGCWLLTNQRLTAPLEPPNEKDSNTPSGRPFHARTLAGRKHLETLDVLQLRTSNS